MWKEVILNIFHNNQGKFIGTIAGLIIAVFILLIGFFKTLFIAICAFIGYYIGKKIDNKESIVEIIQKILPDEWR
ncbi:Uncharacterized membrane protein [Caloramator quimbayensis]|uniref:Uncharacterized membrane protein n=1 Tax=Caloramator quimbayensis TaxID=1147123 RepID=A0A1T4WXM4_9CLOT|nr:DUF2273 domain-containing protein [Caloramator quimbayensis]SKA81979.1 Uncharacterized membrane protein [Caloramator quimbayensis]